MSIKAKAWLDKHFWTYPRGVPMRVMRRRRRQRRAG